MGVSNQGLSAAQRYWQERFVSFVLTVAFPILVMGLVVTILEDLHARPF